MNTLVCSICSKLGVTSHTSDTYWAMEQQLVRKRSYSVEEN